MSRRTCVSQRGKYRISVLVEPAHTSHHPHRRPAHRAAPLSLKLPPYVPPLTPLTSHPARFGAYRASAAGRHRLSTRCGGAGMTHELGREGDSRVAPLRRARAALDGEIARNRHFWGVLVEFGRAQRCSRARRGSRWLVRDARPTSAPVTRAPTSVHARSASILVTFGRKCRILAFFGRFLGND